MRRWKLAFVAVATLVLTLSGTVQATHGGPEHRASGRGERDVPATSRVCIQTTTLLQCLTELVTSTDTYERFDFDARIGRRSPGAHGHMTYELSTVTVTAVERTEYGEFHCQTDPTCLPESGPTETRTEVRASADVTCLTVVQNRAAIGGIVTRWEGTIPPQRSILFSVTDNTIARQQVGGEDRFASEFSALVLDVCPPPDVDAPITKGDIKVDQS